MSDKYVIGEESIITRRYAEQVSEEARKSGCSAIDLSNVDSISRSVADEFVHQTNNSDLSLTGQTGDVKKIIEIVASSAEPTA